MTAIETYSNLAGKDFVNLNEEHSGVFCHVVRVLPDHYRTTEGLSVPGLVVNEFRVQGKVRSVIGAWNIRADLFVDRHRQVELGL